MGRYRTFVLVVCRRLSAESVCFKGIVALSALGILESLLPSSAEMPPHSSAAHLHPLIESLRLAFADARSYVADTEHMTITPAALIDPRYCAERRRLIQSSTAIRDIQGGTPVGCSNTVSFQTVDKWGNAVSMVNSNYM